MIFKICSLYSSFLGQLGGEKSKLKYHCQASSPNPATVDGEGFDWRAFVWWFLPWSLWWGTKARKLNLSPIFIGFINILYPWRTAASMMGHLFYLKESSAGRQCPYFLKKFAVLLDPGKLLSPGTFYASNWSPRQLLGLLFPGQLGHHEACGHKTPWT